MMRMRTWLAALTLVAGMCGAAVARQGSGGEQLKLENQILTSLVSDPDLKNNSIDVRVENGVATLKGTVDTESERAKANGLAQIKGVTRVDDQLEIGGQEMKAAATDSEITAKLMGLYLGNPTLKHGDLAISTNNGVVNLSGTVPSEEARQQAVDIARNARGVSRVEDNLRVAGSSEPMAPPEPMPPR